MPFQKGNKHGKGRKPGSKNLIPLVRDIALQTTWERRQELRKLPMEALLLFTAKVMPKNIHQTGDRILNYISNVPRNDNNIGRANERTDLNNLVRNINSINTQKPNELADSIDKPKINPDKKNPNAEEKKEIEG